MYRDLIGKPFMDGGRGPDVYDCWGLAQAVFRAHGIELPDYKICCNDATGIDKLIAREKLYWRRFPFAPLTPSLVVIQFSPGTCDHVGTYIGEGKFIHTFEKANVCISRLDDVMWRKRIEGFYFPAHLLTPKDAECLKTLTSPLV